MDSVNRLEVYIPVEAEVKNIPLWSLPSKVLRKMGLPPSEFQGSKKLSSSPEGIWICPAVVRRKGQKHASNTEQGLVAKESSLLSSQVRTTSGPLRMSFVSSNKAAYKVLRQIPGTNVAPLPQGSAPQTYGTAVVVYRGRIYLSIRKHGSSPSLTSSSLSSSSSKRQKKQLPNENRLKKKPASYKESKTDAAREARDASSTSSARPVLQATARGQQATRETSAVWLEPVGGSSDGRECEMQDLDGGDAESSSSSSSSSSSQNGARIELLSAARSSASLAKDYDDLAQEEKIARMKARLRQNEAALNNLQSAL